jgi:hypothetical protein
MATISKAMRTSGQLASPPNPRPEAASGSSSAAEATHLICWRSTPEDRRNRRIIEAIEATSAGRRRTPPIPPMIPIAGESMPSGLSTA